ncbi:MAG: hypothetical protein AAGD38_15125 [Acidobacteriota bacterium]
MSAEKTLTQFNELPIDVVRQMLLDDEARQRFAAEPAATLASYGIEVDVPNQVELPYLASDSGASEESDSGAIWAFISIFWPNAEG